jgi:hypothetical protein
MNERALRVNAANTPRQLGTEYADPVTVGVYNIFQEKLFLGSERKSARWSTGESACHIPDKPQ